MRIDLIVLARGNQLGFYVITTWDDAETVFLIPKQNASKYFA